MKNVLYYGDNLDILKRDIPSESVDLVYLDPPFNSNANYNVLFAEKDGSKAASQIRAFTDTWTWSQEDEKVFAELVTGGGKVADVMQAFRVFLGPCDMLAYLVMMAPRLAELRRVLKHSGSIYLHCDPTASHYLKLLMDAVFGPAQFVCEIIWKRTSSHNDPKRPGRIHDILLFYAKGTSRIWNPVRVPLDQSYIDKVYTYSDSRGRYRLDNLTAPGISKGVTGEPWRGVDPTARGRHWRTTPEEMERLLKDARIQLKKDGTPSLNGYKQYLDDSKGMPLQSIWDDIPNVTGISNEKLGYPTQKPEALLERIIAASSNPGDVVLDPFCGCGTTIAAAQKLNRRWIGIDITHLAITLMKQRLKDTFGIEAVIGGGEVREPKDKPYFRVIGEPVSVPDAAVLAASDPYQFQWWALGLVGARPVEEKKGADKGIDGKIVFQGDEVGKFETVILSVKAGQHVTANHVRDLRGVVDREKAALGVLISMEDPTKPMRTEAATAGHYDSKMWGKKYPKIQLLTVADILAGKRIDMPPIRQVGATFKKAERHTAKGEQLELT